MIPEFPKFKHINIKDLDEIEKFLEKYPRQICELNLTNFFIWRDFDKPQLTKINENLCFLITPPNEIPYFFEPLGNNRIIETLETCLKHTKKISRVSESFIKQVHQQKLKITCIRDQFDYIHLAKDLSELKGKKYDGKRNHIKKFKTRHPEYKFSILTKDLKNQALDLYEKWFKARKQTQFFQKLAYESQKTAISEAFSNFEKLNLIGGALYNENTLIGFSLGSKLNNNTVSVHLQYGDPSIQGTTQIILWETCNNVYKKYKYVNLEQDLGIPGLRKSKLSYYPIKLERKFQIEK